VEVAFALPKHWPVHMGSTSELHVLRLHLHPPFITEQFSVQVVLPLLWALTSTFPVFRELKVKKAKIIRKIIKKMKNFFDILRQENFHN
jgi:hypothetical protein